MLPVFKRTGIAATVSIALLLTGCAADSGTQTATLTQTKGPTQLLRNEASTRIPSASIETVSGEQDHSVACKTTEEDPDGLYRSWQSSLTATIESGSAWRVKKIGGDLADSFIEDGWYVSGTKDGKDTTTLTRPGAVSTLAFTTTDGDADGAGATILIDATGPCVLTEGPDSSEVQKLEASK